MTAVATGPWYEVQGLAPCPAADHGSATCSVPDEGEWLPIYFLSTSSEMASAFNHVMNSTDPMYDRYDDFRMAVPAEAAVRRYEKAKKRRVA